jgi:uncharacterized protein YbjT (DUF2867 family)
MMVSQASSAVEHQVVATVLIIGASRGIGLETVKAALEAGHSVHALARSARRIPIDHPKLEKMAGDALETAIVKRALSGVGAVIQSLGVSAGPEVILKPTRFFSKATRVLVTSRLRPPGLIRCCARSARRSRRITQDEYDKKARELKERQTEIALASSGIKRARKTSERRWKA